MPTRARRGHRFWRSLRTGLQFYSGASLAARTVKNLLTKQETWGPFLVRKIPWRRKWQPTPVFLPGEDLLEKELGHWKGACLLLQIYKLVFCHIPYSKLIT